MLLLIDLQIAAVKNTLMQNAYVPYLKDGKTELVAVGDDPSFNAENTAKLCVKLTKNKARDVQSYVKSIENRLYTVKLEIANL